MIPTSQKGVRLCVDQPHIQEVLTAPPHFDWIDPPALIGLPRDPPKKKTNEKLQLNRIDWLALMVPYP